MAIDQVPKVMQICSSKYYCIGLHSNNWDYYFLEFTVIHFILQYLLPLVLLFCVCVGTIHVLNRKKMTAVTLESFSI